MGVIAGMRGSAADPMRTDPTGTTTQPVSDAGGSLTVDGRVAVYNQPATMWSYHEDSAAALTGTQVAAAPGAGLSLHVTDIVCSTGAATALNILFAAGGSTVLGPYYLEAVNGRGVALHFQTPKVITANTALTVTTSAAIAHSLDVLGFTA